MISSNDLGSAGVLALGFCALPAPMVGSSVAPSSTEAARAAAAARNLALASIAEAFGAAAAGFLAIIGADARRGPALLPLAVLLLLLRRAHLALGLGLGYSFFPSALFF